MGGFRHEQRRLEHRGRIFHFVSYEAQEANVTRGQVARPESWYLVSSGNRWPAIPLVAEQPEGELHTLLVEWLESQVFAPVAR
jgi:hypothetical protein